MKTTEIKKIFIVMEDETEDSLFIRDEIPTEQPNEEWFLMTSVIYWKAEVFAKKYAKEKNIPIIIWEYEIIEERFVNGKLKTKIE